MFFRQTPPSAPSSTDLAGSVARALPGADSETLQIVTAVVGLFGCVSYADREFSEREQHIVRNLLQTIHGISASEADGIMTALRSDIITISTTEAPRFSRVLFQLTDRDLRLSVLDMLLDIAAVDHDIASDEVVVLRQITKGLGLEQGDYNHLQSKHRSKLRALQAAVGEIPSEPQGEPS
jgi:uncharacterized tellurite resistance protein B-like protein